MGLADKLAQGPAARGGQRSVVGSWLASLSPADREAAVAAMVGTEWATPQLLKEFGEYGLTCSPSLVNAHRRKLRDAR